MIESEDEDEEEVAEEEGSEEDVDQPRRSIHYVMGDVTHPLDAGTSDRIVVHCAGKLLLLAISNCSLDLVRCSTEFCLVFFSRIKNV